MSDILDQIAGILETSFWKCLKQTVESYGLQLPDFITLLAFMASLLFFAGGMRVGAVGMFLFSVVNFTFLTLLGMFSYTALVLLICASILLLIAFVWGEEE